MGSFAPLHPLKHSAQVGKCNCRHPGSVIVVAGEIRFTRHNLPHWQQPGATYFVTFRLGDSLPADLLATWKTERDAWQRMHPTPLSPAEEQEYHRLFSARIDGWLDAGHGSCALRDPETRAHVANALTFFEGVRYRQLAWVIMPNHGHVCFALHPDWALEKVIFTWKRHSARRINQAAGRTGSLWQRDYFDRLIRNEGHLGKVLRYIRNNPAKAKLRPEEFSYWESEFAKGMGSAV